MSEKKSDIKMGTLPGTFDGKVITLCVTEDCNLACRYCYMVSIQSASNSNL